MTCRRVWNNPKNCERMRPALFLQHVVIGSIKGALAPDARPDDAGRARAGFFIDVEPGMGNRFVSGERRHLRHPVGALKRRSECAYTLFDARRPCRPAK